MKRLTILSAAITVLALVHGAAQAETFVRMLSGPAGGSWYPFGAKIMEIMQKDIEGIRTSNGPGGGVGNIRNVNKGAAELGWTYGHTAYNGYAGRDEFKEKNENIRFLAALYPGVFQTAVPANSSIRSYKDLANKNISPGKLTFSGNVAMEKLLGLYGITYDQIKKNGGAVHRVGYDDSVALMKDGHIDAFVALTSVPSSSFLALDFSPGIRFLPVEDEVAAKFINENPGFYKIDVPAGSYKSVKEAVPTLASATVLIASKELSDELVYKMADVLWKSHAAMTEVHKSWAEVKLQNALDGAAIPVHPGALKYYKEKGVAK